MTPDTIRAKAFAVLRRGDAILVGMGEDKLKGERFGRIVGGGIDFGETSEAAAIREMQEEFGITVKAERLLGWIENIFTYEGRRGHQLCAVWEVSHTGPAFFARDSFTVTEADHAFTAAWLSPARMRTEGIKLYPEGLAELVWPA